jgi:hypothetical protein
MAPLEFKFKGRTPTIRPRTREFNEVLEDIKKRGKSVNKNKEGNILEIQKRLVTCHTLTHTNQNSRS